MNWRRFGWLLRIEGVYRVENEWAHREGFRAFTREEFLMVYHPSMIRTQLRRLRLGLVGTIQ